MRRRWIGLVSGVMLVGLLAGGALAHTADDGATTGNSLAAASAPTVPLRLAVFYGWPSLVNGAQGDLEKVGAAFAAFDLVVLGSGLENTRHPDHAATRQIMAGLGRRGVKTFGYVDLGVTTSRLTQDDLFLALMRWQGMGVHGVFFDDAGFDFAVTRARQAGAVMAARFMGLAVMANAHRPADLLAPVDEAGQPYPPALAAGDWLLSEGWLVSAGREEALTAWAERSNTTMAIARAAGVRVAALATTARGSARAADATSPGFQMAAWAARMLGADAFGWTDAHQGADDNQLLAYPQPDVAVGRAFAESARVMVGPLRLERRTDAGLVWVEPGRGGGFVAAGAAAATAAPGELPTGAAEQASVAPPASGPFLFTPHFFRNLSAP